MNIIQALRAVDTAIDTEKARYERAQKHIREALRDLGEMATLDGNSSAIAGPSIVKTLTEKQQLVLKLLAQGLSTKEIGIKLKRSRKTIEAQRDSIRKRLNIATASELLRFAKENDQK